MSTIFAILDPSNTVSCFKLNDMNIKNTLNEIVALSIEERINLVQDIWDSIAADRACADLTDIQKQELDRCITDYDANPDNVLTWEEVKASIKRQ
jgi:putative addiction module component (TIGR02574 family)